MTINNGVMGRYHFGGEHAHTTDHPPVILTGPKKDGSGEFSAGLVLAFDSGELTTYTGSGTLAGVCDELCPAKAAECPYLAHGTVKDRLLTKAGALPWKRRTLRPYAPPEFSRSNPQLTEANRRTPCL